MTGNGRLPRAYGGDVQRKRELTLGPVAPWHATVTVDALRLDRGRHTLHPVEWTGPPAIGFPPSDRPVQTRDTYIVDELDLARALARLALAELGRGGEPPDLRALAADLRARR